MQPKRGYSVSTSLQLNPLKLSLFVALHNPPPLSIAALYLHWFCCYISGHQCCLMRHQHTCSVPLPLFLPIAMAFCDVTQRSLHVPIHFLCRYCTTSDHISGNAYIWHGTLPVIASQCKQCLSSNDGFSWSQLWHGIAESRVRSHCDPYIPPV